VQSVATAVDQSISFASPMTSGSHDAFSNTVDVSTSEIFDFDFTDNASIREPASSAENSSINGGELTPTSRRIGRTTNLDSVRVLPAFWDLTTIFPIDNSAMQSGHNDDPGYLTRIGAPNAYAQHSADLIIEALYAIPEQMLRRETFPPFIHPHWQYPALPEALAICMQLAGVYSSRAPEIKDFLWRTILAEQRRAVQRLDMLSDQEALAQIQAGMVYLTMRLVDGVMHDLDWTREMLTIQNILCTRFLENNNYYFCHSEQSHPSLTWEDWIYAESRRRTSLVWFLITRTIVVVPKTDCHTTNTPDALPLPAPQMQWEARTRDAWLKELGAEGPAITTFGSLVNAKQHIHEQESKQLLSAWNAKMDRLGSLLNIAVALI
jgi:hypothetical protein